MSAGEVEGTRGIDSTAWLATADAMMDVGWRGRVVFKSRSEVMVRGGKQEENKRGRAKFPKCGGGLR